MLLKYIVKDSSYQTVKQVLKEEFQISDRLLLKLKSNNKVYLNSKPTSTYTTIQENDILEIFIDFEEDHSNIVPTQMELTILYEDDAFLILNKPAGIAIHPSRAHFNNTLSNGVCYYFDQIHLHRKIRPINRLDLDTSGITIFAKNEYIQECLIRQMKNNQFQKEYVAIVEGKLETTKGVICLPIARKNGSIIEREVNPLGDFALTKYSLLLKTEKISFVHILLKTGRTHQIRVHFSHILHPILGDTLYGSKSTLISRQALHAYKVRFIHPITKATVEIIASIPNDMQQIIQSNCL